jgi:serine/threonine protein kinase
VIFSSALFVHGFRLTLHSSRLFKNKKKTKEGAPKIMVCSSVEICESNSVVLPDTHTVEEIGAAVVESTPASEYTVEPTTVSAEQVQLYSSGIFEGDSSNEHAASFEQVNAEMPVHLRQLVRKNHAETLPMRPFRQCEFADGQLQFLAGTKLGSVVTHRNLAIKMSRWEAMMNGYPENFLREAYVYSVLPSHPNLVQLIETAWDVQNFYLITERVVGCDMQQYVCQSHARGYLRGGLPVSEVQLYFRQMCMGLQAMHEVGICNLDFSLENSLVSGDELKLCDFGQAMPFERNALGQSLPFEAGRFLYCTKSYCTPPEMVAGLDVYGDKADSFALGSCLYSMLQGAHYTGEKHCATMYNPDYINIMNGRVAYHARHQCRCGQCRQLQLNAARANNIYGGSSCRISEAAAQLIASLMCASPNHRASVADALQSAFLNQ